MRAEDQVVFSQSWSRISGPYHTEANWVKRPWEDGPGWPDQRPRTMAWTSSHQPHWLDFSQSWFWHLAGSNPQLGFYQNIIMVRITFIIKCQKVLNTNKSVHSKVIWLRHLRNLQNLIKIHPRVFSQKSNSRVCDVHLSFLINWLFLTIDLPHQSTFHIIWLSSSIDFPH